MPQCTPTQHNNKGKTEGGLRKGGKKVNELWRMKMRSPILKRYVDFRM
jgi:hypothetical protein